MAWVRLDDDFYQHPKVIQVGPLGLAMQVAALCYSNHNDTRGVLPYAIVPRLLSLDGIGLAPRTGPERPFSVGRDADPDEIAGWLVDAGIWLDRGDSYLIHDYDHYQLTDSELSEKRAEAGRKGAEKRWAKSHGKSHPIAKEVANGKKMALANPVPVPVPVPDLLSTKGIAKAQILTDAIAVVEDLVGSLTKQDRASITGEVTTGTPLEWFTEAVRIAGERRKKSVPYVLGIIQRFHKDGFESAGGPVEDEVPEGRWT